MKLGASKSAALANQCKAHAYVLMTGPEERLSDPVRVVFSVANVRELREIDAATARELLLIAARRRQGGHDMAQAPDKIAALVDAVRVLEAMRAPHALIGGVAVGIHSGAPRATIDTDLAIASTVDRAEIVRAMIGAGFRCVGEFAHSINFRHSSEEPVQLAVDPAFDAMIERAERFDVSGASIRIVQKSDLIAMKERAAADPARRRSKRLRDEADVALLRGDVPDPDEGW